MTEKEKDASGHFYLFYFIFFSLCCSIENKTTQGEWLHVSHQGLPVRESVTINPTERVVMNASSQ